MDTPVESLREQMGRYNWYHSIEVAPGLVTPGLKGYEAFLDVPLAAMRSLPLSGARVLDIGCRDGFFALEAERMGASEVVGIDNDLSPGAVEFLIPALGSRVQMREMNVNDLTSEEIGTFDVVLFFGVLYHLRYPFWALRRIASVLKPGGRLLIETGVLVDGNERPLLYCPTGETPYREPTSVTFFNLRGLTDTLRSLGIRVDGYDMTPRFRARFDAHKALVNRAKRVVKRVIGREVKPNSARVTFSCTADPTLLEPDANTHGYDTLAYWDGTHRIHTEMDDAPRHQYSPR